MYRILIPRAHFGSKLRSTKGLIYIFYIVDDFIMQFTLVSITKSDGYALEENDGPVHQKFITVAPLIVT